jgi:hypothetical protein
MRSVPGGVDAVDRTSGHVESCPGTFRLRQDSRTGMVCGEIPQPPLFRGRHETLGRELLAWSWGLFWGLALRVFWNRG